MNSYSHACAKKSTNCLIKTSGVIYYLYLIFEEEEIPDDLATLLHQLQPAFTEASVSVG